MQVSIESTSAHERKLCFQLPNERYEARVGERLREISRNVRIKGFRPGKVPAKVVEQMYGPQVRAEALDMLVTESFGEAIRNQDLRPAGNPRIEPDPAAPGSLAFVATFEVVPDFGALDVSTLSIARPLAEVADADLDQMIETLRVQRRTWREVSRAAVVGDAADLRIATRTGERRLPETGHESGVVVIGSGNMLAAIESALEGMQAGEEKTIQVTFPADWRVADLAGQMAAVELQLVKVSEPVLPEADAAFIKSFGIRSGDMAQFRKEIRSNLERELAGALSARLRREVGDRLVEAYASVELPPRLVEDEARAMAANVVEQARRQGQHVEAPADAHLAFMDAARKRVLVGLLIGEIARRNSLQLDGRRVEQRVRTIASTYEQPEAVIDLYRNDPNLMASLRSQVMEEQVLEWIAEHAQHTERRLAFSEAIQQ